MTDALPAIVMHHLLTAGPQAAALAVLIGVVLLIFQGRIAPRWRHRLWWVVALRLALPILPASPVSLYQWLPAPNAAPPTPAANIPALSATPPPQQAVPSKQPPTRDNAGSTHSPPPSLLTGPTPQQLLLADPTRPAGQAEPDTLVASDTEADAAATPALEPGGTAATRPDTEANTSWYRLAALTTWLAIAGLLFTRTLIGWFSLRRRLRYDTTAASHHAQSLLDIEARILKIKSPPRLRQTPGLPGPVLVGVVRPTLLLPTGLADALDDQALRLIFRHELCHLRGHDNLANWLLALLQAAHWFNPLAWWAIAQLRAQRELARDARTVAPHPTDSPCHASRDHARRYAEALLVVARFSIDHNSLLACHPSSVTSAAVRDRKHLSRRLAMLDLADRFRLRHSLFACVLLVVLGITGLTVTQGHSEDAQTAPADEPAAQTAQPAGATDAQPALDGADAPTEEDTAARTARQIVSLDWDNISFEDAIADLEQQTSL